VSERVSLELPLDAVFGPVVRLIVGGIAERADFGFEDLDDLQLAIERLLAEAGHEGRARLDFELGAGRIRARVGPLPERGLADALQRPDASPGGGLTLGRILTTVVDSYGFELTSDGDVLVRLEKLAGGATA